MTSGRPERMKRERGSALILVLIALSFGALTIVPALNYTNTGRNAARISQEHLLRQYANDGAVEYSLWKLAYNVDGIVDTLGLANPSHSTSVTLNGITVPTNIDIALFNGVESQGDPELPPFPPIESGVHIEGLLNVTPKWVPCGQEHELTYDIHIRNYGTSSVGLGDVSQILPPVPTYVAGSFVGPAADLTEAWVTDHWELLWDFTPPRPRIDSGGTLLITFRITVFVGEGTVNDFGTGVIHYQAKGTEQIQLNYGGTEDPIAIGLYDITTRAGTFGILANAAICESAVKLISYQIE